MTNCRLEERLRGKALDAAGIQQQQEFMNQKRALAVSADATGSAVELKDLWRELTSGRILVTDSFMTASRCYLVVARNTRLRESALSARAIGSLERYLLGEQQKSVAIDLRLSISSISGELARCLNAMGVDASVTKVPLLLVVAVHAFHRSIAVQTARVSHFEQDGHDQEVLSIERLDERLPSSLSAAERQVVSLRIEGRSLSEIACLLAKSPRTVANQLASVAHKVGASRRCELLSYLVGTSVARERAA